MTGTQFSRRSALGLLGAASGAALAPSLPAHAGTQRNSRGHGSLPRDLRPGGAYDQYVHDLSRKDEFSGTILLTHCGKTVLTRSFGMADKHQEIPNGPDTIYAVGSITKMFTGLAIVHLAEHDGLKFHQTIGTYLDGFPATIADTITIHDLLLHTSGLGDFIQTDAWKDGKNRWDSEKEVMDGISEIVRNEPEPSYPPGAGQDYSNSGYHLLGEIVAAISGVPYYDYIRDHVFDAADMTDADFYTRPRWRDDPRIAIPYTKDSSGERVDALDQLPFVGFPAGHSHATAEDLAHFASAVQHDELLDAPYTQLYLSGKRPGMWSDTRDMPAQPKFGTYGPHALLINGQWGLGHNGGAPGIGGYLEWYPAQDIVSVILANYDPPITSTMAAFVRKIVMGGW